MVRNLCILGVFLALHVTLIQAEESGQEETNPAPGISPLDELLPRFRGRVMVLDINARLVEQNQTVIWNESHQKTTIPGRSVGLKLVGSNLVVAVQFTPYVRQGLQKFLVAQGQIWVNVPNQGISYHTSMQTIPLEFGEPIFFFPLGSQADEDAACIEVILTLYPYEEDN